MHLTNHAVLELLQNYAQCEYPLSVRQIHQMLPMKIDRRDIVKTVGQLCHQGLVSVDETRSWYTIRGHEITFQLRSERIDLSRNKRQILDKFVRLLCVCPWVSTVVLTGSLALENAKINDDIDLMIFTAPDTMFLCRTYAFVLARVLGLARKRLVETQQDAICVNIWLDGTDLLVPARKMNVYGAREIVNGQVVMDRDSVFDRFVSVNSWVYEKLPNWEYTMGSAQRKGENTNVVIRRLNALMGRLQLWYMRLHITNEIVSQTQLWFHPKIRH